jgi:hypothetical protein
METGVFGNGPFATQTGTGIFEPVIFLQGASAGCPRTPDLLPSAYRDTWVVGQDLSWSRSTGNFAYLIRRITSDGICCFW